MNNFKNYAISLNMLHRDGPCGILGFTTPLISILKRFQSKYIYTLNRALCAPFLLVAISPLLLGASQTWDLPSNLIRPPVIIFLAHILNPIHQCLVLLMETFYQHRHISLDNAFVLFVR